MKNCFLNTHLFKLKNELNDYFENIYIVSIKKKRNERKRRKNDKQNNLWQMKREIYGQYQKERKSKQKQNEQTEK